MHTYTLRGLKVVGYVTNNTVRLEGGFFHGLALRLVLQKLLPWRGSWIWRYPSHVLFCNFFHPAKRDVSNGAKHHLICIIASGNKIEYVFLGKRFNMLFGA